jgi:hypothetical protein
MTLIEHLCHLCLRSTRNFPTWDRKHFACVPCWRGYVNFRRAYKRENGRYPTVQEFRDET